MSQLSIDKFGENLPVSGVVAFSQIAIGLGIGLLVGGRIGSTTRRVTTLALMSAGIATLVPVAIGVFSNIKHRPSSSSSMRKRLESIRHDSGFADHEDAA